MRAGGDDALRLPHRYVRWLTAAMAGTLAVYVVAGALAVSSLGGHYPGLFVDPFGSFSAVSVPVAGVSLPQLRFPDRVLTIDGVSVGGTSLYGDLPSAHAGRLVEGAFRRGQRTVHVGFSRDASPIEVDRPLLTIDAPLVAIYFILYGLAGLMLLWSGAAVLSLSSSRPGGIPYAFLTVGCALLLGTFFDYHSTTLLSPVFLLSTLWCTAGYLWVALTFPEPPAWWSRARSNGAIGVVAALLLIGAAIGVAPFFGCDLTAIRVRAGASTALSCGVLLCSILTRFVRSRGAARTELKAALVGTSIVPAVGCAGFLFAFITGVGSVHLVLPLLAPLLPLSIGWALIRHNILGADAVLTRRLLVVPVALLALGAATIVWLALRNIDLGSMDLLVSTIVSGGVLTGVALGLHRLVGRHLFPAAAEFRPTIQQLAESLTEPQRRDALGESIERTVARWLPSGRIRLLEPISVDAIDRLPADARGRLDAGQKVWTDDTPWQRHLLVPMRSLGQLRGVLDIAPKHQGALFTEEDLSLLDTIAALGAIALHNAEVMAALDETRRIEVDATRDDKKLTLGLLGAELSHEIAHPLQFFRGLLRRGAKHPLDPDDVEIGGEEIARMERLLGSLRRLEPPPPHRVPVVLRQPIERALVLVKETLADKNVRHDVDVPDGLTVIADPDALVQIFANLLRNAAQAAPPRGRVGVVATPTAHGLTIEVWDDGPGVPEALVDTLFHRWFTTRGPDGGSGLGLSVAQSLVYGFGWTLEYLRDDARTRFCITVPSSSLALDRLVDPVDPVASPGE